MPPTDQASDGPTKSILPRPAGRTPSRPRRAVVALVAVMLPTAQSALVPRRDPREPHGGADKMPLPRRAAVVADGDQAGAR